MGIFNDNSQNDHLGHLNLSGKSGQPGPPGRKGDPGIGFNLTADGNFDINGKLLTNVAGPANGDDATNKNYVDTENAKQNIAIADKASKSDLNSKLNIDGSNSMTSDLNLNINKVINISGGTNNGDAVNYGQLLSHSSNNHQNNYHLQKSFTFYKNFGDKVQLNIQNINITNHNHHDLLVVKKEGSDPGFHGEAWVSLKMTNNLPAGDYTVLFEIFAANIVSASNITFLNHETLFQQVLGDANYKIITFSHDYQTTHSKSHIQFTSNGQAGEITFQIKYYGSSYNNSNLNFLFYSRAVAGRIGYAFNHNIFDVDDVQLNNQILYFEDINLNGNKLKNIAPAEDQSDAVNLRQLNDIYYPYLTEIDEFQFFRLLSKLNPINVSIGSNIPQNSIIRQHNHNTVYRTEINPQLNYGTRRFFSMEYFLKNMNLAAGDYTFAMEIMSEFSGMPYKLSKFNINIAFVTGHNGITIKKTNHQYINLTYNKAIIQFTSDGKDDGYITFKFGSTRQFFTYLLVFITLVNGLIEINFNHDILDTNNRSTIYITNIDMNNKKIYSLPNPIENSEAVNKAYVDNEIAKLPHSDTVTLKLDGSRAMIGNLLMAGHSIIDLKDPNPSDSDHAASVNFVNKTIDDRLKYSVQSADKSNAFQYVMDNPAGQFYDEDDIKGIKKTVKDFHKINKETYEMQLLLDSIGHYSSRLGVNMYILPNGEYSLVYELYYPNSIDSSTVQISAVSSVETVSKVTTNVFSNHTRSIIHLHKHNNVVPNRLMIDIVLKNKAGISYANELTIFVIVYGVSGYVNNVHTSVWDRLFEVTNNGIKFEAAIDMNNNDIKNLHSLSMDNLSINRSINMNNRQIKGLADGIESQDAINVKQLNETESNVANYAKAEITKVDTSLKKIF